MWSAIQAICTRCAPQEHTVYIDSGELCTLCPGGAQMRFAGWFLSLNSNPAVG